MNKADETVASDQAPPDAISDAETLRALADPLRLRILWILMEHPDGALPVMSVKELAADLGEPQTKLYRHVKHLEAAGLIKAVSSRVVSGIVEQRYQACHADLVFGATPEQKMSAESEAATVAVLELYRSQYFAAYRSSLASSGAANAPEREPHRLPLLAMHAAKVPPAKAAEISERLHQVLNDITEAESNAEADGTETVKVNVLLGYFSPETRPRQT